MDDIAWHWMSVMTEWHAPSGIRIQWHGPACVEQAQLHYMTMSWTDLMELLPWHALQNSHRRHMQHRKKDYGLSLPVGHVLGCDPFARLERHSTLVLGKVVRTDLFLKDLQQGGDRAEHGIHLLVLCLTEGQLTIGPWAGQLESLLIQSGSVGMLRGHRHTLTSLKTLQLVGTLLGEVHELILDGLADIQRDLDGTFLSPNTPDTLHFLLKLAHLHLWNLTIVHTVHDGEMGHTGEVKHTTRTSKQLPHIGGPFQAPCTRHIFMV